MPESGEVFTLTDRRELIKQGIQLDKLTEDIGDVKTLIRDDVSAIRFTVIEVEKRIRLLEEFNIKIRTSLWLIGIFFTTLNAAVDILLRTLWK